MSIFSSQFTPLQALIIISWVIFFLFAIDALQRKRFNALHFLVFFWWISVIILFAFNISLLNKLWTFFGLNRGADLLVYISIILLAYFYFEILNKVTKQSFVTTKMITEQAIKDVVNSTTLNNLKITKNDKYSDFVFLIRAYNEETAIWWVIEEIIKKWFTKIVVVNDWSIDNTAWIVNEKISKYKNVNIILLSHLINRLAWSANKTWFEFLRRYWEKLNIKYVVTYDADWQMDIDDIDKYIEVLNSSNYDILLGSRFLSWGNAHNIPKIRKLILLGSKIVTYIFNWLWVTDPHNGYRVITLDALKRIKIVSDWMIYASELLEEIHRLWLKYKEIPVNIRYTDYSLNKWQKNWNAIKIVLGLIYNKFFYK